ncbi:MAG: alpha/beta fold hydrolase [Casimicrobiaceae bacterium]|nr:alpha/beta fold hydrolase [Casimicrobiaceae bacterium]MDW8311654.1 alpha/beta fold hydrolase [Burkholderiales bacterium]
MVECYRERLSTGVHPTAPILVCAHALGANLGMWRPLARELAGRISVLAYDHRGQGRSSDLGQPYTMADLVEDAAAIVRAERERAAGVPIVFCGLSMGGMVAQGLAAAHPGLVDAIVVANSAMFFDEMARQAWRARIATVEREGLQAIVPTILERWFTPGFRAQAPETVEAIRRDLLANDPAAYVRACQAIMAIDFRQSNRTIGCPTLVMAGEHDGSTPPALSEAIAASIPGARLARLATAHLSAVEAPQAFASLVESFCEELPRR